jgi:hypothetical protein
MSPVCISTARTSRQRLGRRTRTPRGVRALATAPSIRPPRPHAEAHRTTPSRAGRFDRKRICHDARVSAIKAHSCGSRPSTPRSAGIRATASAPPRSRHRASRSSPRPRHRHQSARGEPNRAPVPRVALVRPHLAAGELPRRREGLVVKPRGFCVN